jgi:peptide-methionine (S)-S-oxide reductase
MTTEPSSSTTSSYVKATLIALLIAIPIAMAFQTPNFVSRLLRPLTSSSRMGLSGEGSGGMTNIPEGAEKATIAAGCFWGVEHIYRKNFKDKGLYDAKVGYIGGDTKNPSYRSVCSGKTGRESPPSCQL